MTKINLRWLQYTKWSGTSIFLVCVSYLFCFVLFCFFALIIFPEIYFGFFNRCLTDCL